jgi:hypothetical protein
MSSVTQRMQQQIERWQEAADQRSDFLRCYLLMTENMLAALEAGEFHDPSWVDRLLDHFADYYFSALEAYEQDPAGTPAVWRMTFDSTCQPDALVLQNLLLGVNAHINYDLVFTLADMLSPDWQELSLLQRQERYQDHCQVNAVIRGTIDSVQDTIIEAELPAMNLVDTLFGQSDEWIVGKLITRWRDEVWEKAQNLLTVVNEQERLRLNDDIEQEALQRAKIILRLVPGS